jgi:ParD-like antitoxin of type II bacterial toxin-antitoxin system
MSQPVKLSDVLVLDARLTGAIAERSIAGQIEYWANLGRAIEPLLQGRQALALCKKAGARPLAECLASTETPKGRRRLEKYLDTLPFPHYQTVPHKPGFLVRIEENGKRTIGRFINRQFQPARSKKA